MKRTAILKKLVLLGLLSAVVLAACGTESAPPATSQPIKPPPDLPPATATAIVTAPTATPEPPQPAARVALYSAGTSESARLYALDRVGASHDLGRTIWRGSAISRSGRWMALPSAIDELASAPSAIEVTNADTGQVYPVTLTAGFWLFGMAFDPAETRLALLEMGWPEAEYTPWAYLIVDLADGSVARFAFAGGDLLPGAPLGWTGDSAKLFIQHFVPYSGGGWGGVSVLTLPPETTTQPVMELTRQQLHLSGYYAAHPRLSADGARLLYLARAEDYTPADYDPIAYDLAVNQLWVLDAATYGGLWVNVTDGGALGPVAAFSPDGARVLFAQGRYAGDNFAALTFQIHDGRGMTPVGPVPGGADVYLADLAWCSDTQALALIMRPAQSTLYQVTLPGGALTELISAQHIEVLGCLTP